MTHSRRAFLERSAAGAALLGLGAVAAPEAGAARLPAAQVRALRAAVRGRVLTPSTPGYGRARLVFNRRFDAVRPPAVVRVRDAADVRAVVRWADRHGVRLVSRSGGHGYAGGSTSGSAVVVDLGAFDGVGLSAGGVATVGPGARTIDVLAALARRGVALPTGSCPTVGFGGLVLGGGMGLAGRALGLTLDRVVSLDVVTADGRLRRVDARRGEDLFWALRGGGGSFGVVTAVRLRVRPVRRAAWFSASFPAGAREEALAAWDDLGPGAPAALTSICTLSGSGASVFGQFLGPAQGLRRLVAPLARAGGRLSVGSSDWLALQRRWAGCADGGLAACRRYERSAFAAASVYVADPLSARGRAAFVAAADAGTALVCDAYGGAINRVPAGATAFVHRDARFSVQVLSYAALPVARARVRRARRLVAPHGDGQAYQNYADLDQPGPLRAYYGSNLPRLRAVKREVDPEDRFRVAQGIPPA